MQKRYQLPESICKVKIDRKLYRSGWLGLLESNTSLQKNADIALSAGGDNYCYGNTDFYAYLNRKFHRKGIKTVLWGCSVEPEIVHQENVKNDLKQYELVAARESITYEAVYRIQKNTVLIPNPAFFMPAQKCILDKRLKTGSIIGINISPMIISNETVPSMVYENYRRLIRYILSVTDAVIALIPHVVWASNDDRRVLRQLYDDFDQDPRLVLVEDHTAPELKYIISRCDFFVGPLPPTLPPFRRWWWGILSKPVGLLGICLEVRRAMLSQSNL